MAADPSAGYGVSNVTREERSGVRSCRVTDKSLVGTAKKRREERRSSFRLLRRS
jgi:hypothetical protein